MLINKQKNNNPRPIDVSGLLAERAKRKKEHNEGD